MDARSLTRWLNRPGLIAVASGDPLYEVRAMRAFVHCDHHGLHGAVPAPVRSRGPLPTWATTAAVSCYCPNHDVDTSIRRSCKLLLDRRVTFVMTNDFYKLTLGRWFFKLVGAVPVNGGKLAKTGMRRAAALVKAGHAIVIFPEGGLSRDGKRRRGQRGVAILARRTGAPIVPVGIVGSRKAWGKDAGGPSRSHVRVSFGPAMYWPEEVTHPTRAQEREFVDLLMEKVERTIERVHAEYPHLWAPTTT